MQDVYSEIAKLVQNRVARDEADGVPEAMVLRDNVNRKLVKQTVMTSVYGVTFVGARQQIGNRLKERGWDDERLVYKTSCYGARVSCFLLFAQDSACHSHMLAVMKHLATQMSVHLQKVDLLKVNCVALILCMSAPQRIQGTALVSTNVMSAANISRQLG